MGRYTQVVLDTCAYAGTGNVLKVQEMLHVCAEHLDENAEHQVGGLCLGSGGTAAGRTTLNCCNYTAVVYVGIGVVYENQNLNRT